MAKKNTGKKEFEISDIIDDKKEALKTALENIEKSYGKGAVMLLGQTETLDVDSVSTGSLGLDIALGIGGVPRGRVTEIYGPESSGKTTVALSIVAQAQKAGGTAAFIDVEHALDPAYARVLGVDIDNLLVSQPNSGEQALEIAETLIRSGAIDVLVVDSVAAMVTRAEIEGDMGDAHVGLQARLMSQAMRKLTGIIGKTNCVAIFINQVREKIGIVYGNPETTPGGRALKFYSSVRIEVRKGDVIKNGGDILGSRTRCKVVKNKVAPPFKEAAFDLIYGEGISYTGEILDFASELDIVKKSGSWFSYNGERMGQGRDNAKVFLKENPDICAEIAEKVKKQSMELVTGGKMAKKSAEEKALEKASAKNKPQVGISEPAREEPRLDVTPDETDFR